ncbi:hypothetical protein L2Z99_00565 [Lactobacillus mulieris]|jgi:hypothetical protein|uniref:Uncharacterized protein n=2 Tax=root TaxID=1 RepID=A0AAW5WVM7_9LACO|nr:hypothetical protein [Lactobacillus mulieris]KAA9369870.1 hypothetical protein F6I25_01005 [Lactobacillus jensenii]DAD80376.1 MAG TPA: hypothetical protein [Siphoviridae sp. ctX581]MCW8106617.1 hypothetical protein [Lactobacillus mulieris]MCZ9677572.1 hypothetical protein [Lactobacillus mulieris]MDK7349574.1 hypothetical protein [Lactobacillus mulieris]
MKYKYTDVQMINDENIVLDIPWEVFKTLDLECFRTFKKANGDEVVINGNQIIMASPFKLED